MEKIDLRTISEQELQGIRKSAIRLVKSGMKKSVVSEKLGLRAATLSEWIKNHNEKGISGLKGGKKGKKKGEDKLLTPAQERAIQLMITDKNPEQLKLAFALWTRKAIVELIDREFGIKIAIRTMGTYLASWGFTPQKPKKLAYEQCSKKVQKWLDEEYPAIKEEAQKENAEIYWGDETGARNQSNHGRSYAPKGKTPVKRSMAKKFSVNMISAITNQGKVMFMIYSDTMNADKFIEFMKQLIKTSNRKIYFIVDNLRVHHSSMVKEWVANHSDKIRLLYLPSYSPERNPDEYLNCDLKQGLSAKPAPRSKDILENNIREHMDMLSQNAERVAKYFQHDYIKYAS